MSDNMRYILICVVISCCEAVLSLSGISDSEVLIPEEKFVEAHNNFAVLLYRSLSSMEGNFFFCAICVSSSLSLLLEASRGKTSVELNKTLGYRHKKLRKVAVRSFYSDANSRLLQDNAQTFANAIFIQDKLELNSSYLFVSRAVYNTEIKGVDLWGNAPKAVWDINEWTRQKSKSKFRRVLERMGPVPNAALLVNALMLEMNFSNVFGDESTKAGVFHNQGVEDRKVTVPMLHKANAMHRVATSYDFRALELPYDPQSTIRVWFLLPHRMGGLPGLEDGLSSSTFKQLAPTFAQMPLDVTLPVAHIEFHRDISKVLQDLGIRATFSPSDADFAFTSEGSVVISGVLHKSLATIGPSNNSGVLRGRLEEHRGPDFRFAPPFVADRPFLFVVVDTKTGLVLHMGRIVEF